MSALDIFTYAGHEVRTILVDGEPWFVAADAARILGYSEASALTRALDDDEKGLRNLQTLGGEQALVVVNEPGLYSAILRSRVPEAKAFKRWLTHEVLPTIRKTGQFGSQLPGTFAEALELAAVKVRELEAAEARLLEVAPKVEAFDTLMDSDGNYSMESAAKMLGLGRTTLFRRLRDLGIIQRGSTLPYQRYMHHFDVIATSWTDRDGGVHPARTTRVRPTGLEFIRQRLSDPSSALAG